MYRIAIGCAMLIAACGRVDFAPVDVTDTPSQLAQRAYLKASNTGASDLFDGLAVSADGTTIVVIAPLEDSAATGIDGNQADDSAIDAGAAYVFVRSGASWVQQAYLKASNTGANDQFGQTVALSADGSTLAIGAPAEASGATGVGANQNDNSAPLAGAVYVFTRTGAMWTQQDYIKASNAEADDRFGSALAISADGKLLAVGASHESSAATGIGGDQADNTAQSAGAVYVFAFTNTWTQRAYIKASNTDAGDHFGVSLALSGDGSTLAVTTREEDSSAIGVGGDQTDNSASSAGAVYVFKQVAGSWSQQAYVKATNTDAGDQFGFRCALSDDGSTLAVTANGEASRGDPHDNSAPYAGAAYIYTRTIGSWSPEAYIKASNADGYDEFGISVSLSGNGSMLVIGANSEASAATGIGGDQTDNSAPAAGAAYVFHRGGTGWTQTAYVKASNTTPGDEFGDDVAVSSDATTVLVTAAFEASAASGVDGDQLDNSAPKAGAVYVFQ